MSETNLVEAGNKTLVVDENWLRGRHQRLLYLETNNLERLWANEVNRGGKRNSWHETYNRISDSARK